MIKQKIRAKCDEFMFKVWKWVQVDFETGPKVFEVFYIVDGELVYEISEILVVQLFIINVLLDVLAHFYYVDILDLASFIRK